MDSWKALGDSSDTLMASGQSFQGVPQPLILSNPSTRTLPLSKDNSWNMIAFFSWIAPCVNNLINTVVDMFLVLGSIGVLKVEWAILPPGSKRAEIPEYVMQSKILPLL